MLPGRAPGADPGRYHGHRVANLAGLAPGAIGQQCEYPLDLDHVWRVREDLPRLFGTPFLLWVAGDENAPTYWLGVENTADRLSLTGTATPVATPWVDREGDAVPGVQMSAGGGRSGATGDGPGSDDLVIISLELSSGIQTNAFTHSYYAAGRGVIDRVDGGAVQSLLYGSSATLVVTGGSTTAAGAWQIKILLVRRSTNQAVLISGGVAGAPVDITGLGDLGSSLTFSAGYIGTAQGTTHHMLAVYQGAGEADRWAANSYALPKRLTALALGTMPEHGDNNVGLTTHTRATAASAQDRNGVHHFFSSGMPRAGETPGDRIEEQRINRVYRTAGVPLGALAEWIADDASTATGVADTAALATALASAWGPNVPSYANATGATRYVRCGAATGAVTRFALSVYARIVAGAGAEIGWWDTAGPGWTSAGAITDGYATRTVFEDLVPPAATCVFCLKIPNGCTLYWFAAQSEGSGSALVCPATTPIPNFAAAATAQRNWDDLVLPYDPADGSGGLEFVITPYLSGAAAGGMSIAFLTGGGFASIVENGGTWQATLLDGTTTIDSTVAPVAGTAHRIRTVWDASSGVMAMIVRDDATGALLSRVQAAYDGSLRYAGTWEFICGSSGYHLRDIRCLREFEG